MSGSWSIAGAQMSKIDARNRANDADGGFSAVARTVISVNATESNATLTAGLGSPAVDMDTGSRLFFTF